MNIKPHPNHQIYLQTLSRMTPEQRLMKAFELSELTKRLFLHGLRKRFPEKTKEEITKIYIENIIMRKPEY